MSFDVSSLKSSSENITQVIPINSVIDLDFTKAAIELEYPPLELTADSTTITSGNYGTGNYIASASSTFSLSGTTYSPYLGFESQGTDNFWHTSDPVYNSVTGSYIGTSGTLISNGTNYSGEWLQLQMPGRIRLTNFSIIPRQDGSFHTQRSPTDFVILGSDDNTNWNLVYNTTGQTWSATKKTFSVTNNTKYYSSYRLVVTKVGNNSQTTNRTSVQISRWQLYGEPVTKLNGIASSTGLGNYIPSGISRNGLIAYYDPSNPRSYPGTGGSLYNLIDGTAATLAGSYNFTVGNIRLNNTSPNLSNNTSSIRVPTLNTITSVSLWYRQESVGATGGVTLLDMRTGGTGGWIWSGVGAPETGTNWTSGTLYKNGGSAQAIRWSNIQNVGNWQNITVIANTPATDDMTIFANANVFGFDDGLDVTFGPIMIYNRVITQAENLNNFQIFNSRYGLDGGRTINIERPIFYTSGGPSNSAFLRMESSKRSYLESNVTTSSLISTNGGFTMMTNVRLSNSDSPKTILDCSDLTGTQRIHIGQFTNYIHPLDYVSSSGTPPLVINETNGSSFTTVLGTPSFTFNNFQVSQTLARTSVLLTTNTTGALSFNSTSGSTLTYQFIVPTTGSYNVQMQALTSSTNASMHYSLNGVSGIHTGGNALNYSFYNLVSSQNLNAGLNTLILGGREPCGLGGIVVVSTDGKYYGYSVNAKNNLAVSLHNGNATYPVVHSYVVGNQLSNLTLTNWNNLATRYNNVSGSIETSIANSVIKRDTAVAVYPPAALTTGTAIITGQLYGNGTYSVFGSSRSNNNFIQDKAFNKDTTVGWSSSGGKYDINGSVYILGQSMPPGPLTGNTTTLSGYSAGNGTFTAVSSSVTSGAYFAFDGNTSTSWNSDSGVYNTAGSYIGTKSISSISGEWIYLNYNTNYGIKSITLTCNDPSRAPNQLYTIAGGSVNGGLLTAQNWSTNPTQTFSTGIGAGTNWGSRNGWGILVTSLAGTGGSLQINEMYGTVIDPVTVTDTTNTVHNGEYLQCTMPSSIILKSFTLISTAKTFALLGSSNGSTWNLLYNTPTDVVLSTSGSTILTNVLNAYNSYRLVIKSQNGSNSTGVTEMYLNGIEQITNKTFSSISIGKTIQNSDTQYSDLDIANLRYYDRSLTTRDLQTISSVTSKQQLTVPIGNVATQQRGDDAGLVCLDARSLPLTNGLGVTDWDSFIQATVSQQPIYYTSGGYQNSAYVNFNKAASQSLDSSTRLLNFGTGGGFTAMALVRFTSTPTANEVVFDFGNAQANGNLTLSRSGTTGTLAITGYNSTNLAGTTTTGNLVQDEWALWSVRHNASSLLTQVYKNGSIQATSNWTSGMTNRSVTTMSIGKSLSNVYSNIDIAALHVYDRPLTDRQLTDMTNRILAGKPIDFVDVNIKVNTTLDISSSICNIDAKSKLNSLDDPIVPGIQAFPPAALTAADTNITGQPYGNGLYYCNASTIFTSTVEPHKAFNNTNVSSDDCWHSAGGTYNATTGSYIGQVTTVVSGVNYTGEWLQIQLPCPIKLHYFVISPRLTFETQRSPNTFYVLGSNDGCSWVNMYSATNINDWAANTNKTFYLSNTDSQYRFYRIITNVVGNGSGNSGSVQIAEWKLYGIPKPTEKLIYPIRDMSANTTTITTGNYATGTYIASSSSILSTTYNPFRAFDSALLSGYENFWHSNDSGNLIYNGTTGLFTNVGGTWMTRTTPDNSWQSVCWSPELGIFVAVANSGTGNRVMTSSDGINWTSRNSAADNSWQSVIWVSELSLFVAVASSGTGNRVMTSSDGINWTTRSSAADNNWSSVIWAPTLSLLVAVATSGTGNRVMTSPNGINWTARTSAADNDWNCVTWASTLSLFVAVASTGAGNRVMTSSNGINWTTRTSAADNSWTSVAWSSELGIFSAVASSGTGNRVMTSTNGIDWTIRTGIINSNWTSVIWSSQLSLFIAVSTHNANTVMTSSNGTSWTLRGQYQVFNQWTSVTYSPQLNTLVAVSQTGSNNRVMTSGGSESGEWLQIQLPRTIVLDSFTILPRQDSFAGIPLSYQRSPTDFILYGSDNNLTWTKIHSETGLTWDNSSKTFFPSIANNIPYNYFRLVTTRVGNNDQTTSRTSVNIARWQLFERNFQDTLFVPEPITNIGEYVQTSPENAPILVSGIQEYPPQNLTANTTAITNGLYGNGTYVASSSTLYQGYQASFAFDSNVRFLSSNINTDSMWHSELSYNATTGSYIGTTGTLAINGTTYSGEWLQLQLPEPIQLNSFAILPRLSTQFRATRDCVILGSNNGSSWDLVYSQTDYIWANDSRRVFNVNSQKYYMYFRLVITKTGTTDTASAAASQSSVNIARWQLFGTPQQTTYLSFNPNQSQHLDGGSKTLSIADNGGFTASAIVRFTSTPTANERIFSFGTIGNTTGNLYFGRNDTIGNLEFGMYNKSISTTTTPIVNGDWDLLSVRYKTSSNLMEIFKDNSVIVSGTVGSIGNVTGGNSLIGRNMANVYSSIDVAKLVVLDSYLTNAQLSILNEQLTNDASGYTIKTIREYPPRALSAYTTNVTGGSYGNGSYTISTSSETNSTNRSVVKIFNKNLNEGTNAYASGSAVYNMITGLYSGTTTTIDTNNVSYSGEWVQLQIPKSIVLTSFVLYPRSGFAHRAPTNFVLLGSNNGTSWVNIYSKTNQTYSNTGLPKTFNVNASVGYIFYRLVIGSITNIGDGSTLTNFEELILYGYESSQSSTSTVSGRYVKLSKLGTSQTLKVPEISVYNASGDLISLNKTATSSSIFNTDSSYNAPSLAFDGNYLLNGAKRSLLYPPSAMIADTTNITTGDYGRGIYSALTSSTSGGAAWNIFDESPSVVTTATGSSYLYNTTTGAYSGITPTSDKFGVNYSGEWMQLTLPETIYPTGIQITPNSTTFATSAPTTFNLLASNNETNWNPILIGTTTTWTSSASQTFLIGGTTGSPLAYDSYRLIASNIGTNNSTGVMSLQDIKILGGTHYGQEKQLSFPPAALTGTTTGITGLSYGNGTYTVTQSDFWSTSFVGRFAFNKGSTGWYTSDFRYNSSTGSYIGSTTMTAGNIGYSGEWITLQCPNSILLDNFQITPRPSQSTTRAPRNFSLFGSNNGSDWTLIYTGSNVNNWTLFSKNFVVSSKTSYTYFRLLISAVGNFPTVTTGLSSCDIEEIEFYGREIKTARTNSETNPFVQVDLGAAYPISKVVVHNDLESPTSIQGTQLSILDANSNEIFARSVNNSPSTIEVFDATSQDILDTTTTVYQDLFRSHNEIYMTFGGYYDGSWKSDLGSIVPYRLAKSNNLFRFSTAQPIGATKVQAWTDRITISSTGEIKLGNNGTGFNNLWEGIYTVGTGVTGINTSTINIGRTLGNTNYKVLIVAETSSTSETYAVTISNKTTTTFDVKIIRSDQIGASWSSTLRLHWKLIN